MRRLDAKIELNTIYRKTSDATVRDVPKRMDSGRRYGATISEREKRTVIAQRAPYLKR